MSQDDINIEPDEEPFYEAEDCEYCKKQCEDDGVEYEPNFHWKNGTYICDDCNRPC